MVTEKMIEAAKAEAKALADRAGIDIGDDYDMFVDDLAQTLTRFAALSTDAEPVKTVTDETVDRIIPLIKGHEWDRLRAYSTVAAVRNLVKSFLEAAPPTPSVAVKALQTVRNELRVDTSNGRPGSISYEAGALHRIVAAVDAALFAQVQDVATVTPSIDTMRDAAKDLILKSGWQPNDRLSPHSVSGLMAEFGMRVHGGEIGCGYPDCGCCADAACEDAIKQHPDFAAPAAKQEG